ncbi:terpene cyclase-like protein [Leptotrombidium deliense]|uniref:Terpene synthase n=1 Tax=Leptotrombidium deliense TaxID=299467 RepID=A0A443S7F8_9ACAR|nr:terpene cyclase-like protein [Leptotrombidium deliense]
MQLESRINIYPKINMCFKSEFNSNYDSLLKDVYEWALSQKLCKSKNYLYKCCADLQNLVCMCYPYGDYERILIISKFMVQIFILDDIIEKKQSGCDFYDSLMKHGNENKDLIELLDKCNEDKETPFVVSFADIWKQLKNFSNISWQKRFAESYIWYLKTTEWEKKNIADNRVPSLNEYLEYRHFAGGVDMFLNLIEIARDIFIPDFVAVNMTFQRLFYIAGTHVCLVNDIHSFEKEKMIGQIHNMVNIMKHEYNICEQEAIDKATNFVNDEIEKFVVSEKQLLPIYEGEVNECVLKYLDGLKTWMSGNHDWGIKCDRYIPNKYGGW